MQREERIPEYSGWEEWTLTEFLGEGAYGKVFKARRNGMKGEFYSAIKKITIPKSQTEVQSLLGEGMTEASVRTYFSDIVNKCMDEIALLGKLKGHPHIVSVEEFKLVPHEKGIGWDIYIRMELLKSLNEYLAGRALTEKEVLRIGTDICSALEYCEEYHIIHRDIKPDNIFVTPAGSFKLGDFGIARTLENTGTNLSVKGTYYYMAPEVYRGRPYGSNIDTYSLGIMLYRLLNRNKYPFMDIRQEVSTVTDREDAFQKRMAGTPLPKPCAASQSTCQVILRACQYEPQNRYDSAKSMKRDLTRILEEGVVSSQPWEEETVRAVPPAEKSFERQSGISDFDPERKNINGMQKPGKSKAYLAGILMGAAALVLAAALGGYFLLRDKPAENEVLKQEAKAAQEEEVTAAPSPEAAQEPTQEPVVSEEPAQEEAPTAAPAPTVQPEQQTQPQAQAAEPVYTTYYVVNCQEYITLRRSPDTAAAEITKIPLNSAVSYVEPAQNGFYKIIYNGQTGYALASYLSATPGSASQAAPAQQNTAGSNLLQVVGCSTSITMRSAPNVDGAEITQVPLGASVSYTGNYSGSFYEITYGGQTGYALASYLLPVGQTQVPYTVMKVVNCQESITLRQSPSTQAGELTQIPLGSTVACIDSGYGDFAKVSYMGAEGYALKSYLTTF